MVVTMKRLNWSKWIPCNDKEVTTFAGADWGGLLGKVQDVPMGILPAKKTKPLIDYLFIIQEQG